MGKKRRNGGEVEMGMLKETKSLTSIVVVWVPHARSGGEEEMGIKPRSLSRALNSFPALSRRHG